MTFSSDPATLGTSGYERRERDFYPTPPECTKALFQTMLPHGGMHIWEPACGDGAISNVLTEMGHTVENSDIHPLLDDAMTLDFLTCGHVIAHGIVTNPPYGKLAEAFARRCIHHVENGNVQFAALLMRHEYDAAKGRHPIFGGCPLYYGKLTLLWRPQWIEDSEGSPRFSYAWYIWSNKADGTPKLFYAKKPS